jgi:hypothetical protein
MVIHCAAPVQTPCSLLHIPCVCEVLALAGVCLCTDLPVQPGTSPGEVIQH